ncbi:MAG TPA: efflux RND transporter periplasmic adaptor subunit [Planctomycetes bacterium]|nr:efflux RND transporter periplasmic adaptor subunit [Planctomycetota bacterium]
MHKRAVSTIAILVILGLGALAWFALGAGENVAVPAPPRELGPVPVRTLPLTGRDLAVEVEAHGTLVARREAVLALEVSGRIERVADAWRVGARIEAGTELVALDPKLFELAVASAAAARSEAETGQGLAEIELERARKSLERAEEARVLRVREFERLVELRDFATDSQRDQALGAKIAAEEDAEAAAAALRAAEVGLASAEARTRAAEAALARAREELARSHLTAPFTGLLVDRPPSAGSMAAAGASLGRLLDPASIVLVARVPAWELSRIDVGNPARIEFPTTPETAPAAPEDGVVSAVGVRADPLTRRGEIEIAFRDTTKRRVAGRFARAVVRTEELSGALWVPRSALDFTGGEARAFVLRTEPDGTSVAEERRPVFARSVGEGFLVESGLSVGETLITHPLDRIADGVAVRALPPEEAAER